MSFEIESKKHWIGIYERNRKFLVSMFLSFALMSIICLITILFNKANAITILIWSMNVISHTIFAISIYLKYTKDIKKLKEELETLNKEVIKWKNLRR